LNNLNLNIINPDQLRPNIFTIPRSKQVLILNAKSLVNFTINGSLFVVGGIGVTRLIVLQIGNGKDYIEDQLVVVGTSIECNSIIYNK
jgi:hypothetical protein